MNALKKLIGNARPQIPLEAMISGKKISMIKSDPKALQKSLAGRQYHLFELTGNTDEDTQDFIGSISMGGEVDIERDVKTGQYTVYCDSIEIGRLSEEISDIGKLRGYSTYIQKIELSNDGIYIVTIAAAENPA